MKELTRHRFAVTFSPRGGGWWLLVIASAIGFALTARDLLSAARTFPTALVTGLVFTVPLVVGWWWLLRLPQLWSRVSRSGAVAAISWGACASAGLYALPANGALMTVMGQHVGITAAQDWGAALVAPLTEETGKAFAIVVVLLAAGQRLRTPMDAALLGAFAGVGFTATEDVLYALNIAFLNLGENQVVSTTVIYFARAMLFGPVSHVVFSGVVGAGIGVIACGRLRGRLPTGLALIALGAGLHGLWNSPLLNSLWARFAYVMVVPFIVWALLHYLRREERAWFIDMMSRPGALGVIPPPYLDAVRTTWWKRRAYRASVVRSYGEDARSAQRALEARLTDLADAVDSGHAADQERIRAELGSALAMRS